MNNSVFPRAAYAQFPVVPGSPDANVRSLFDLLELNPPPADTLVVLPELWATGFDPGRTGNLSGQTPELLELLVEKAKHYSVYFAGSLPETLSGAVYNTLFIVGPEGLLGRQPKQYLFSAVREDKVFQPGSSSLPIETPFGQVGGLVCYDLRFPEIARELAFGGAGLIVVSALWPMARREHWLALLKARAIENQVFVVGASGCGASGRVEMAGSSVMFGPDGKMLSLAGDAAVLAVQELDRTLLDRTRGDFCPPGERRWRGRNREKVVSLDMLKRRLDATRKQGSRIAFTNGCFDLLHAGHVSYLERARSTADCLVLGLNSDESVRRLKGPTRPVNTQEDRALVLASLGCVDFVVIFEEDTPLRLITQLLPDVLVKGADWPEDQIVGAAEVKSAGGFVERIGFEHDRSTTSLIDKIQKQ